MARKQIEQTEEILSYQTETFFNAIKETFPNIDFNKKYKFYYDESNNCRKFHILKGNFNTDCLANFILGGLVLDEDQIIEEDFNSLFEIDKSINDIKFRHIAYGDFLNCLNSKKLKKYLIYLNDNNILVHYSSFNLLYWSIVDIVDSAFTDYQELYKKDLVDDIKNAFYFVCKENKETVINIFLKYHYPNLSENDISGFIDEIIYLILPYIDNPSLHFPLEFFKGLLQSSKKNNNMPFIVDENDYVLVESFVFNYLDLITLYNDSSHTLDIETSIIEDMKNIKLYHGNDEIQNYIFVDSKTDIFVQLSDVISGLIGKLKTYLNKKTNEEIFSDFSSLKRIQYENLVLLSTLLKKSETESGVFIQNIDAKMEISKMNFVMNFRDMGITYENSR